MICARCQYIKEVFFSEGCALAHNLDQLRPLWLTEPQSFHLIEGVSESLAGRVGIIEMLGLSNTMRAGIDSMAYGPDPK